MKGVQVSQKVSVSVISSRVQTESQMKCHEATLASLYVDQGLSFTISIGQV